MRLLKWMGRIALLAAAAALFAGMAAVYAGWMQRPARNPRREQRARRRPRGPRPEGAIGFAGEAVLAAAIAVGGRKILRLRL